VPGPTPRTGMNCSKAPEVGTLSKRGIGGARSWSNCTRGTQPRQGTFSGNQKIARPRGPVLPHRNEAPDHQEGASYRSSPVGSVEE
jgi:hypothetical protein